VALGLLIVIITVYFQQGIVGWLMDARPEWFGVKLDPKDDIGRQRAQAPVAARAEAAE
jgi:hypothetical protein